MMGISPSAHIPENSGSCTGRRAEKEAHATEEEDHGKPQDGQAKPDSARTVGRSRTVIGGQYLMRDLHALLQGGDPLLVLHLADLQGVMPAECPDERSGCESPEKADGNIHSDDSPI